MIKDAIAKLMGWFYDIAHRIGAYFGKSPRHVYLQQGTKGRRSHPGIQAKR
jgi:hypothetical protein